MENIIKTKKQRWVDLYSNDKKSGAVIFIGRNYGARPLPVPENRAGRIEYALSAYKLQMDALPCVDDDRIPFVTPYTGTELFAHAFGCQIHYPANDMPFALPLVQSPADLAKVKYPDLYSSPPVVEVFEIADKLRASEPDALMQLPDIQSPFDIAALIWNKEDLFASMYEDPGAVKELVLTVEKFMTEFLDLWFSRYGTEFIAHHPDYYMPCGITYSEDEVGAFSLDMFREFSLGSLNRLSERYGGMAGMHCCADSMHQWQGFKEIKDLKLINLNLTHTQNEFQKAYKYFEDTAVQMHSGPNIDDELYFNGKNMRVVIQDWANTKEEAAEKSRRLREKYCSQ